MSSVLWWFSPLRPGNIIWQSSAITVVHSSVLLFLLYQFSACYQLLGWHWLQWCRVIISYSFVTKKRHHKWLHNANFVYSNWMGLLASCPNLLIAIDKYQQNKFWLGICSVLYLGPLISSLSVVFNLKSFVKGMEDFPPVCQVCLFLHIISCCLVNTQRWFPAGAAKALWCSFNTKLKAYTISNEITYLYQVMILV